MRILYLSCHSVLEYDEVKLFTELGYDVFSHGVYSNPRKPGDPKRPPIWGKVNHHLIQLALRYSKDNLHPEMIDWADVIVVMHIVDWIKSNWEKMKKKVVVWRSIGQSTMHVENMLRPLRQEGLKIVRYSPREKTIPGFVGEDVMIRFYKDPKEFKDWRGVDERVITVGQSMKGRRDFCGFDIFERATRGLPRLLVGPDNDDVDELPHCLLSYEDFKKELRFSRVFFYTGTYPASYTLGFIEALMTGIPVVAIGPKLGNSPFELGQRTYEIPDIIKNGVNGFYSDDIGKLRKYVKLLLNDYYKAQKIGDAGRRTAIELFSKEKIKKEWKEFFDGLKA